MHLAVVVRYFGALSHDASPPFESFAAEAQEGNHIEVSLGAEPPRRPRGGAGIKCKSRALQDRLRAFKRNSVRQMSPDDLFDIKIYAFSAAHYSAIVYLRANVVREGFAQ